MSKKLLSIIAFIAVLALPLKVGAVDLYIAAPYNIATANLGYEIGGVMSLTGIGSTELRLFGAGQYTEDLNGIGKANQAGGGLIWMLRAFEYPWDIYIPLAGEYNWERAEMPVVIDDYFRLASGIGIQYEWGNNQFLYLDLQFKIWEDNPTAKQITLRYAKTLF